MSLDDLLIAIIIAGTGLSGAYLSAKYVSWRRTKAAERRREFSLRELYANKLCDETNDASVPSVILVRKASMRESRMIRKAASVRPSSSFHLPKKHRARHVPDSHSQ